MRGNIQLRSDLSRACQQIQIESTTKFFISELPYDIDFEKAKTDKENSHAETDALAERLSAVFYGQLYTRTFSLVHEQSNSDVAFGNLIELFHQANDNKDGWDPGWVVYKVGGDGSLLVHKGDRSRRALPGEYSTYKWPGVSPKLGDLLSIRTFAHSTDVQPAFFFAFGRTLSDQFDDCMTLRFYFNISANTVVQLMEEITRSLNHYLVPFKFKALVDPMKYSRADAAVLYVARRYYGIVASLVMEIQAKLRPGFRELVPLFTKRLVAGIGMAEEPEEKGSFGMHRSGVAARAIVNAWRNGTQDVDERMSEIETYFSELGIDLDSAYLNPKSEDIFDQVIFEKETRW